MERSGHRNATFGVSKSCNYRPEAISEDEKGYISFDVKKGEEKLGHVNMAVPGMFNALNALSAVAAVDMLGVNAAKACSIIGGFTGARRRFELTGTLNGAELFTDYGHNPTEIRNAVSIARKRCKKGRLWAVLQLAYCMIKGDHPGTIDVIGCYPDDRVVSVDEYDPFSYLQDLIWILDWVKRFKLLLNEG